MKYRNVKTGFVFESKAKCTGEDIEVIPDVSPAPAEEVGTDEPDKTKAPAKKRASK